jgi:DNA-binding MarR family transcriptional regulator
VELAALEHLVVRGGLTPGELGHRLGLTSGGVTALTGRLIEAGYVRRERHPSDGRMRVLGATEAGAEFLNAHVEPLLDLAEAALSGLAEEDASLLADVLELVASAKDADAAATPGPEREYESDGFSRALLM